MLSVYGCKTKKDLKAYVCQGDGAGCHDDGKAGYVATGQRVKSCEASRRLQETSMFGPEFKGAGQYPVVGPAPYERKWFAMVHVDGNGRIVKVV